MKEIASRIVTQAGKAEKGAHAVCNFFSNVCFALFGCNLASDVGKEFAEIASRKTCVRAFGLSHRLAKQKRERMRSAIAAPDYVSLGGGGAVDLATLASRYSPLSYGDLETFPEGGQTEKLCTREKQKAHWGRPFQSAHRGWSVPTKICGYFEGISSLSLLLPIPAHHDTSLLATFSLAANTRPAA